MVTDHNTSPDAAEAQQRIAAEHLYNAECALHTAHQSHVDAWICAASNRLHEAISAYLAAAAAAEHDSSTPELLVCTFICLNVAIRNLPG